MPYNHFPNPPSKRSTNTTSPYFTGNYFYGHLNLPEAPDYPARMLLPRYIPLAAKSAVPEFLPHLIPEYNNLPDPKKDPGLYAAATELVKAGYLYAGGGDAYPHPTAIKGLVRDFSAKYRTADVQFNYPLPPDTRLLWCRFGGKNGKHMWADACSYLEDVANDQEQEKEAVVSQLTAALESTHHTWTNASLARNDTDSQRLWALMVRYILMCKHAQARATSPDLPPSPYDIDHFIRCGNYDRTSGVIPLAVFHQRFYNCKDIPELAGRIFRFCDYNSAAGGYAPKPQPNELDVDDVLSANGPMHFPDLLRTRWSGGVGSEYLLRDLLVTRASPDVVTKKWVPHDIQNDKNKKPHARDVYVELGYNGVTLDDLARKFPNQVPVMRKRAVFRDALAESAYSEEVEDEETGEKFTLWFLRYPDGEGGLLDVESSKKTRAIERLMFDDPKELLELMDWNADFDHVSKTYVKKDVKPVNASPQRQRSLSPQSSSSSKRKRSVEDDGAEEASVTKQARSSKAITEIKPHLKAHRCSYPANC